MLWKKHLFIGFLIELLFLILIFFYFKFNVTFILLFQFFIIMIISPLVSDLDHHQGKLREITTLIGIMIGMIGAIIWYICLKLNFNLNIIWISFLILGVLLTAIAYLPFYVTHHRGFMHSVMFSILYGLGIYFLLSNYQLGILGAIGIYSHLVCDKEYFKIV